MLPVAGQAPPNDAFDNRIPLGRLIESVVATNTLATAEAAEPGHRGTPAAKSVWWRWVAPMDGYAVVDSTNSAVPSRVAVYDGSKQLPLLQVENLRNESGLPGASNHYEFSAVNGLHYNLALDGVNGAGGPVRLDLKVFTLPEYLVQPITGLVVTAGQRTNLSVRALGALPLTYQWQFSNRSPNAGFVNVPNGNDRIYNLGAFGVVSKNDEGWYRVYVRNQYGAVTSSVCRVEVNECAVPSAPRPSAITNDVGKTAAFSGSAFGTPPLFYQWQFKSKSDFQFQDLPGATSSNLVMTNLSVDHTGQYRFLVWNVACTNPSSPVDLFVTTNNSLVLDTNLPRSLLLITNENASFDVRVIEGYQPISFQWWYSPNNPYDSRATRLSSETATNLFRPGVQVSQAGWYWVTASNHWGRCPSCYTVTNSRAAYLTVETRPPNDNFENRTPIFEEWWALSTSNISQTIVKGWNKNGTVETNEPLHQARVPARSVWWSFRPPVDGRVIADLRVTAPVGAHPVLAVYTGEDLAALTPVANLTNSTVRYDFVATNNYEYVFVVESEAGAYREDNIFLDFLFNPDLGAPTIGGMFGDLNGDFMFFGLGGLGDGEGCRTFDRWEVSATSLDGVVRYQWQFGQTTNGPFANLTGETNAILVLPNITVANQGWYRVDVSNTSTNVFTRAVYLQVGIGPNITDANLPRSIATNACGTATFEIKAESCSPMTYQWRHNGVPVAEPNAIGVTSNILFIASLTPTNAGTYDVVIRNSNLSVTSRVATLVVTNTAVITAQPQPVARHGCDPASFRVSAIATCPLTYQWYFQGLPISQATSNTLNLASVLPADAGDYFVTVSTPFASVTSQVVRLTVETLPVIITQPAAQSVRACEIVNLAVQPQGEPTCSFLSYQWQLGGANILGATGRVHSFEAQAETAGNYRVILSNRWASITSAVATVAVDARPSIALQPLGYQRIREGDVFTNRIDVSICGALTYSWEFRPFGGTVFSTLAPDARHQVNSNGWLTVLGAQTNESGYYRVIAANSFASVTSALAQVRIVSPPPNDNFARAIHLGRTNQAIATGYNEFATSETGEPSHGLQPPTRSVWWSWTCPYPALVTVDLAGSDIDTTFGAYTGSSVDALTTLALDDDGGAGGRSRVSFMVASNQLVYLGVDGKRSAEGTNLVLSVSTLPIISPPVIVEHPVSLAVTNGETISFTNVAWGSPDIAIQWYGKGVPRTGTKRIIGVTNYQSILTLTNVTPADDGVYYVVLSNSFGVVTSRLATVTFGALVRGFVTDATRTTPLGAAIGIPDVRVCVGDACAITDTNGNYEISGVQPGALRADFLANKTRVGLNEGVQFWNRSTVAGAILTATKNGFYDYIDTQFDVGPGRTVAKRFSMSPIFAGLRFVLNWTNKPSDLDLILKLPSSVPIAYPWIDYLERNRGSRTEPPFAIRDADTTLGWGPETITIHRFYPGTYSVYARKYPGEGGYYLTQSAAQIVAYKGGDIIAGVSPQLRPYESIDVPATGNFDWWHVCDIDGATTNITWINQLLPSAPGGLQEEDAPPRGGGGGSNGSGVGFQLASAPAATAPTAAMRYEWNFGDGSPINTQFEPVHPYAEPGWKTVSLKVSLITATGVSHTLTRTNYIYVENLPPIVRITNPPNESLFRGGDPITLQSEADGIDDGIAQVDYFLVENQRETFIGSNTIPPYTVVYPNTNQVDRTNVFIARARDTHGATGTSAPVTTRTFDLRGDILIIRNHPSVEIDRMVTVLTHPTVAMIRYRHPDNYWAYRPPVVKVLDQEGLHLGLVLGFKLIIWNDQGTTQGGLTDNDVDILNRAYSAGIPLYLMGEQLSESRNLLHNVEQLDQWTKLLGFEKRHPSDVIPGPLTIQGIKPVRLNNQGRPEVIDEDGLFYGWYNYRVETNLPYSGNFERVELKATDVEVTARVPIPGSSNYNPVMLRWPRFTEPDFGETRRLVQNFRATSDQAVDPPESAASDFDRKVLLVNGCAWLLRLYECQEVNPALACVPLPPLPGAVPDGLGRIASGRVGQPMTNTVRVTQNGECTATGVIVTEAYSPCVEVVSASLNSAVDPSIYKLSIISNQVIVRFSQLISQANYELTTVTIPRVGGWITNRFFAARGVLPAQGCVDTAFIAGNTTPRPFALRINIDRNDQVHLIVLDGAGCTFQVESSSDLRSWHPVTSIRPSQDIYDVTVGPAAEDYRFFKLRRMD